MAYRLAAIPMTFNVFQGRSSIASLFRWDLGIFHTVVLQLT